MRQVVIIPALNPQDCLEGIVDRLWEMEKQVIVVDDGSTREYEELFQRLENQCIVLHHLENKGKGEAIKTALHYIQSELWECGVVGIMDADGQHLPEDMDRRMKAAGRNPRALVLGCRQIDGEIPWKSRMGNLLTRQVFRAVTGVYVSDTQTGLRAFSSEMLRFMLQISGSRYEYEMNVLTNCARKKIQIIEIPIQTIYHDRTNSCSHFRKVKDSIRIYKNLLKFTLSSFSSFLLDYFLFALLTSVFPATAGGILAANISARIFSGGYNYFMNCKFVFHEGRTVKTAAEYFSLAMFILVMNNIILQILIALNLSVYPAKIITEAVLFFTSWMVQRKFIFQRRKNCSQSSEINPSEEGREDSPLCACRLQLGKTAEKFVKQTNLSH